jgi:hypothetical protein
MRWRLRHHLCRQNIRAWSLGVMMMGVFGLVHFDIERPELPKGASFFTQQTHHEENHG